MHQMLRAKCHWGLHIGMLKPTLSIRAFGDPLVRARKAGRLDDWFIFYRYNRFNYCDAYTFNSEEI